MLDLRDSHPITTPLSQRKVAVVQIHGEEEEEDGRRSSGVDADRNPAAMTLIEPAEQLTINSGSVESEYVLEEVSQVSPDDVAAIKVLFSSAFPLQYGQYFYDGLQKGEYGGRPLLTCIGRRAGRIIAAACASREDETSGEETLRMVDRGRKVYLMTLAVDKEERRKGIATEVLNRILEWAIQDRKCTVVYLHVIDYNKSAMDFYKRMGFTRFDRIQGFYPINGTTHDAFLYLKYVNGGLPPPEEPPGVWESAWDWLSGAISSLASLALGNSSGDGEEEADDDDHDKASELV